MKRCIAVLLVLALAAAARGEVRFTDGPAATRDGETVRVDFTVSAPTDVAVYVLDAEGKVVRHLVAGAVGPDATPPAPLKPGLAQSVAWDGTDDAGAKVADPASCRIRVAAGLSPAFDGFLLYNRDATPGVHSIAAGPDGNIRAFYKDPTANGNQGGLKIKVLDADGRHARHLMPFSGELPFDRVRATGAFQDRAGRTVPRTHNWHTLNFYPDPQIARRRSMSSMSLPAVDANGRTYWIVDGPRLAALDADGGVPYDTFLSEPLTQQWKGAGEVLPALAVSGDGKSLYLAGLGSDVQRDANDRRRNVYTPFPAVLRIDIATRKATLFAGDPARPGVEGGLLTRPRGLAVAGGKLHVADAGGNRIVAFNESDGAFAGEVKVPEPNAVSVDPKSGAVYACSYTGAQTADLVKFDAAGKELYRVSMPKTGQSPNTGVLITVGDFAHERPRLWVPAIPYARDNRRLGYYEDTGEALAHHDMDVEGHWAEGPRDLLVDRGRGELYVKVSGERWHQFNERTGEHVRLMSFPKNAGGPYSGAHGAQLAVTPDGNYITHCWGKGRGLMRWTRDLQPLSWDGRDTHHTEWGGMMTFQLNYMALAGNMFYLIKPEQGPHHLELYDLGLNVKRRAVWNVRRGSVPRVDAAGNIYVTAPLRPLDRDLPAFFDGKIDKVPDYYRNIGEDQYWYVYMYGSIVKFGPEGGAFLWPENKRDRTETEGMPDAIAKAEKRTFNHFLAGRHPHKEAEVLGALWVRFGYAPYSETYPAGTPVCMCEGTGFDVDPFGRVFYPNLCQFRIEMIDTNNNPIGTFGRYGNQDDTPAGMPMAWPTYVAVSDTHAYVNDTINLRVMKVKLNYAADKTVAAK